MCHHFKEVFMGLRAEVGAMLSTNIHNFGVLFFWKHSLLIEISVASSETWPPLFPQGTFLFIGKTQTPLMLPN